ncbi:leucine-rich repeat domain-containing protein [Eubacterium sp.]|uniref:leucine-rich repeat domain-containing protein n=1 Tax=Eubacterium sp. TaxID=142586 RepID=UPI0026E0B6CD|nr:leucine-rich repeat domain-containing protein [Eubacterium sp.]MDO5433596.1 leucine-rich repeat domain-containing protein [Eubacterium sp.]
MTDKRILDSKAADKYVKSLMTIPEDIRIIGPKSFKGKAQIKTAVLSPNTLAIMPSAFEGCAHLRRIHHGDHVKTIGRAAFKDCYHLMWFELSEKIEVIEAETFQNCKNMTEVKIPQDSLLKMIRESAFENCQTLKKIKLPDTIETLEPCCFARTKGLKNIHLSNKIVEIPQRAFYFSGLVGIDLPQRLTTIREEAFYVCKFLQFVKIPETVRHIGSKAFKSARDLKIIEIEGNPEYLGEQIISRNTLVKCHRGTSVDAYSQENGITTEYI